MSEAAIEQRERRAIEYGGYYQIVSSTRILADSAQDFAATRTFLEQRLPTDVRTRLCRIAAQLAGTAGIALVALGEHREARAWFHVAQLAADETGDRALRAWLLAREAVIPFYYGAPAPALALAERARLLAGSTACATAAWAPSLEARALARLGRHREAQDAMRLAQIAFLRLAASDTADTAYGYTERQLVCTHPPSTSTRHSSLWTRPHASCAWARWRSPAARQARCSSPCRQNTSPASWSTAPETFSYPFPHGQPLPVRCRTCARSSITPDVPLSLHSPTPRQQLQQTRDRNPRHDLPVADQPLHVR